MADGQVALVGSRLGRDYPNIDHQDSMGAATVLQLASPLAHTSLHPWLQTMVSSTGQPGAGFDGPDGKVNWRTPNDGGRWLVLRAIQLGAFESVPTTHPVRCLSHRNSSGVGVPVQRWTAGGRTHTALQWVYGYGNPGVRWWVSWGPVSPHPGSVLRIEEGTVGYPSGKGPVQAPSSLVIPGTATTLVPGC